mgnify:CR=1 FL=1
MNSKEFSLTIEGIVKEKKISHMDAVIKRENSTRGHKFKNVKDTKMWTITNLDYVWWV